MQHSIAADWAELKTESLLDPDPLRRVRHPDTEQRTATGASESERVVHAHARSVNGLPDLWSTAGHLARRGARGFPGNEGVSWLRPEEGHRFHAMLRWSDPHRLAAWLESDERASWHARIEGVATEIGSERQSTSGMETWFNLPGTTVQAPPRWKMVLTTFLGAYTFTLLIQWLVAPRTGAWPLPLRAAVFPVVLLPTLTYLVMPRLSRLLRQWLYPPPDR